MEDYKERYEQILAKAKAIHNLASETSHTNTRMAIEELFPELKESEDERIRKELIKLMKQMSNTIVENYTTIEISTFIAWLEKQGKKIDVIENFDTEFEKQVSHLIASTINKEYEYTSDFVKWTANALLNYAKHELEKQDENDVIVGKAKTEKQRILLTETNGSANIDWDTRSLQDVKLLLEYGLDYINKLEKCGDQNTNTYLPSFDEAQGTPMIKQGEQEHVVVVPRFRVGDVIRPKGSTGGYFIKSISGGCYHGEGWGLLIGCEDDYELAEQKPTNNVEPKFKVGDWVVSPNGVHWHIDSINNNRYEVSSTNGACADWPLDTDLYHLWTIKDAKDGDIVASHKMIILFKKFQENGLNCSYVIAYAGIDIFGKLHITDEEWMASNDTKPASKEQRDILFSKMKNAGYEWDAEKKELKKIKQKPVELTEICNYLECQKREDSSRKNILDKWIVFLKSLNIEETATEDAMVQINRVLNVLDWAEKKGCLSHSNWEDCYTIIASLKYRLKK